MTDCMMFPNDWAKFLEDYSLRDDEEIYTNGSRLIPVFRVEQLIEHYFATTWIPVTERLPDSNKSVLVRCTNTTISGGYVTHIGSCDSGKFWFLRTQPGTASFPVREWQVTHWMPLPEPPKEENDG